MNNEKAIALLRVSKERNARDDHYSIPAQRAEITLFAERMQKTIVRFAEEPGTSAFTWDVRSIPELQSALLDIEAGLAKYLIVHESSRLARNERLAHEIMDRLDACGGVFMNVSMGGLDYTTPEGRLIYGQEANLNAYLSRKISQHSKKGKQQQFEQGLPVGKIPFCYTEATVTDPDGAVRKVRNLPPVIIPEEADAYRKAIQDFITGISPNVISRQWNAQGLKPRSVRGLEVFVGMSVRAMLENPFYAGYVTHNGAKHKGRHEPVVDEETWIAAQKPRQRIIRRSLPPPLLRGLARCARCQGNVYGIRVRNSAKTPDQFHYYYREPSPDRNLPCPDGNELWKQSDPDARVEAAIRSLGMGADWIDFVEQEARKIPDGGSEQRAKLEATRKRLQREYIAGRLNEAEWDSLHRDLTDQLAVLPVAHAPVLDLLRRFTTFADLWDSASAETKNEACRLVFESVILDFKQESVEMRPWSEFVPLFEARAHYVTCISPGRG